MLDYANISRFIASKRKSLGFTQLQLAEKLNVTYQAVSKWENESALPSAETLAMMAKLFKVTVDEILEGADKPKEGMSYGKAGVDIVYSDVIKTEMSKHMKTLDKRVLNSLGAFASLYDISFPEIKEPVLVLKAEEPGSKQKLAIEYGFMDVICHDMINHLVNDIAVMGAKPLAVLDTIICGKVEKDTVTAIVKGISDACRINECSLVGGETSIQPGVVPQGTYILASSVAGIIDKKNIIDGSAIQPGDTVLAVESNGIHTNGYTLVRMMMKQNPEIVHSKIENETFLNQILKSHLPYYGSIKGLLGKGLVSGMAHITGGGIEGNLKRVIPKNLKAVIDLSLLRPLSIFGFIKKYGNIADEEMLKTFNCGAGLLIVTNRQNKNAVANHIKKFYNCYEIGVIEDKGSGNVEFAKNIYWN